MEGQARKMTGISSLTLLGTVAEIEQSTTKNGKPWTKLLLEVKRYRQTTDTSGQDEVTFIPVMNFWGSAMP
jgi:hypothetical protein